MSSGERVLDCGVVQSGPVRVTTENRVNSNQECGDTPRLSYSHVKVSDSAGFSRLAPDMCCSHGTPCCRSVCRHRDCRSLHMCRLFVWGGDCPRPDDVCPYGHQLFDSQRNSAVLRRYRLHMLSSEDIMWMLRCWLNQRSPVSSGEYQRSLTLCADYNSMSGCSNVRCWRLHLCRGVILADERPCMSIVSSEPLQAIGSCGLIHCPTHVDNLMCLLRCRCAGMSKRQILSLLVENTRAHDKDQIQQTSMFNTSEQTTMQNVRNVQHKRDHVQDSSGNSMLDMTSVFCQVNANFEQIAITGGSHRGGSVLVNASDDCEKFASLSNNAVVKSGFGNSRSDSGWVSDGPIMTSGAYVVTSASHENNESSGASHIDRLSTISHYKTLSTSAIRQYAAVSSTHCEQLSTEVGVVSSVSTDHCDLADSPVVTAVEIRSSKETSYVDCTLPSTCDDNGARSLLKPADHVERVRVTDGGDSLLSTTDPGEVAAGGDSQSSSRNSIVGYNSDDDGQHVTAGNMRQAEGELADPNLLADIDLCAEHSPSSPCEQDNCRRLHLCRYFIADICPYGDICVGRHTLSSKDASKLKQDGVDCSFDELVESLWHGYLSRNPIEQVELNRLVQLCLFNDCKSAVSVCYRIHLCPNYVMSSCISSSCHYSHNIRSPHNIEILRAYGVEYLSDESVLSLLLKNSGAAARKKLGLSSPSGALSCSRTDSLCSLNKTKIARTNNLPLVAREKVCVWSMSALPCISRGCKKTHVCLAFSLNICRRRFCQLPHNCYIDLSAIPSTVKTGVLRLMLCGSYNSRRSQECQSFCGRFHLCHRFLSHSCTGACSLSHSMSDDHNQTVKFSLDLGHCSDEIVQELLRARLGSCCQNKMQEQDQWPVPNPFIP